MTTTDPALIAARRFGYGPARTTAGDAAALRAALHGPDAMALRFPVAATEAALEAGRTYQQHRKAQRDKTPEGDIARTADRALREMQSGALVAAFARIAETPAPFRERLAWFWADHFTVRSRSKPTDGLPGAFVDEAIRPHLSGSFAAMLKAAVTHPAMVTYLDQSASVGPESPGGQKSGRGLNENLAREVLELHTMGAGQGYAQSDVRAFAELLTGLTFERTRGAVFKPRLAQPGAETVLGVAYGDGKAKLDDILGFLDDLALRPETGRHLARKLAVHFVSDTPPDALVGAMAEAYAPEGRLTALYDAMLDHPAAWSGDFVKIRQPFDFMAAALRALGVDGARLLALPQNRRNGFLSRPLAVMGQRFQAPPGPDGWPEDAAHWLTPPSLAQRVGWSIAAPRVMGDGLPEPAAFAGTALGEVDPAVMQAVRRAESRAEAIGLVLASPAFNRR